MTENTSTPNEQEAQAQSQGQLNPPANTAEIAKITEMIQFRQAMVMEAGARNSANSAKPLVSMPQTVKIIGKEQLTSTAIEWSKPVTIAARPGPREYPIEALPQLIQNAVIEIQHVTQAPITMVACAAVCALATAVQALINVERTSHLIGPASLYYLLLGDSGERKSTVDNFFCKAIRQYHEHAKEAGKPLMAKYRAEKPTLSGLRRMKVDIFDILVG